MNEILSFQLVRNQCGFCTCSWTKTYYHLIFLNYFDEYVVLCWNLIAVFFIPFSVVSGLCFENCPGKREVIWWNSLSLLLECEMLIGTGIWCTVCYIHKSNPQVIILVLTFQPYGVNQYGPVVKYTTQDVDGNTISGTGRISIIFFKPFWNIWSIKVIFFQILCQFAVDLQ